jgi:hypothetical protein
MNDTGGIECKDKRERKKKGNMADAKLSSVSMTPYFPNLIGKTN